MKCIMVMFDTLCRRFLPPYGNDWVIAPNFERLARRAAQFDHAYVGSMPCMPARREIHTGRPNFLHRSWGPLEPFDDSMPEQLHHAGIHSYKVTDHHHYWEDGGATYHTRYAAFEFVRGQEGDPYVGWAGPVEHGPMLYPPPKSGRGYRRQDIVNRRFQTREEDQPQAITFTKGVEFIRRNARFDNWFCQIETFDPHEPFFTQQHYRDLYPHDWTGPEFDWPLYERVKEGDAARDHIVKTYASLMTMCDRHLGRVLDVMDELELWDDTMLIVNTDHGLLMGEHDWWMKCRMPFFQEIAHIPLWIWDPRSRVAGERRQALVQTQDLAPTILEFFGLPIPRDATGKPLRDTVARDARVRDAALYGMFGGHVNVTDGRYTYFRGPVDRANGPLFNYTLMPTHMASRFSPKELASWERHDGFPFMKGCPVMRIPSGAGGWFEELETRLYDLQDDYLQQRPLENALVEDRLIDLLMAGMREQDAPPEQYVRLGLDRRGSARRTARATVATA